MKRALFFTSLLLGCAGQAQSPANGPSAPAPPPAVAVTAEAPERCDPTPSQLATPPGRAKSLLGDAAVAVLGAPTKVEGFRLRLDAEGPREHAPANAPRIAGYLIDGGPKPVAPEAAAKLAALLQDDASLDFANRKPCAVGALFGFRFTKDAQSVEAAFELAGDRVYVATADEPFRGRAWSARFGPSRAAVIALLRAVFAGDAAIPDK